MSLQDTNEKNNKTSSCKYIAGRKCSNDSRRKPPWDPCCTKLNHAIVCKDCGCAYKENKESIPDENMLHMVDFCGYTGKNCCDKLFRMNLDAVIQYQLRNSIKVPCDCQKCRRCRPRALGDHYADCECTLCERRALRCRNRDYYKMKLLDQCDEDNEGDEDCPGFFRYCAPKEKPGIVCDCHDRTRIMRAIHGAKCTCSKCIYFRMECRKCCKQFARTNARRFPKRQKASCDEMGFNSVANFNFFPNIPPSCGHGPLCTCPSEYMAKVAGVQTYMRDETKPCLCHKYAPSHWERKAPCDFKMCTPGGDKPIPKPAWDTSREPADTPITKDSPSGVGSVFKIRHKVPRSAKSSRTMTITSEVSSLASKTGFLGLPRQTEGNSLSDSQLDEAAAKLLQARDETIRNSNIPSEDAPDKNLKDPQQGPSPESDVKDRSTKLNE